MIAAPFEYVRPDSVDDAVALLAEHGNRARLLAGGQSLVPELIARSTEASVLVDIGSLPWASPSIRGATLTIEAGTTQADAAGQGCRILDAALPWVGHAQTRNRGTVVGSLAQRDPLAEIPLAFVLAGGHVRVVGPEGTRAIDASRFVSGAEVVRDDELIIESVWNLGGSQCGVAFDEVAGVGTVAAAAAIVDWSTMTAALAVSGATTGPIRVDAPDGDPDRLITALEAETATVEFIADATSPSLHRRAVALHLAERVVALAQQRAEEGAQ
ncbi:MAG: FAD binding domain-containing protein [Actinomycetota bacterium]